MAIVYVQDVTRVTRDEVIEAWWSAIPDRPDPEDLGRVMEFTNWVRTKQRQRASLVRKAACDSDGGTLLVPWREAALADPYAIRARRRFFGDKKFVSGRYLDFDQSSSPADWQSFFEAAGTELAGKFLIHWSSKELSYSELQVALPGYCPPSTRITGMWPPPRWDGKEFSRWKYLLIDYSLPPALESLLAQETTEEVADDIAHWLQEAVRSLQAYSKRALVFVPRGGSSPQKIELRLGAAWVKLLKEAKWVWDQQGTGPYAPGELLSTFDEARPQAPVARLPANLVGVLEQCGVVFGADIPDVPDLERLKREGPRASAGRLSELIEAARASTEGDQANQRTLVEILEKTPLFPVPGHVHLIDSSTRIPADRLVTSASAGDLGGWLLPTGVLSANSAEQVLASQIGGLCEIPKKPTPTQALSFLLWVWRTGPDADSVRRVLPRAYALLAEGIEQGSLPKASLGEIHTQARVFTRGRHWIQVSEGKVYLDDLGDERLGGLLASRQIEVATSGHLGETPEGQRHAASLLGVPLLSSRFGFEPHIESESPADTSWRTGFLHIQEYLLERATREDDEDSVAVVPRLNSIIRCGRLRLVAVENGQPLAEWEAMATCIDGRVVVAGEPVDFMAELCTRLLEAYDLGARRNLHSLGPQVTQLLGLLDNPQKLNMQLIALRNKHGLQTMMSVVGGVSGPSSAEFNVIAGRSPEEVPEKGADAGTGVAGPPSAGSAPDTNDEAPVSVDHSHPTYTEERSAARIMSLIRSLLAAGVVPSPEDQGSGRQSDEEPERFGSDETFRSEVLSFELRHGRFPLSKPDTQPGFDIDSFTHAEGDPNRKLVRRIEVKGKNTQWDGAEIVELSPRQFVDAREKRFEDGPSLAEDFDYWLYVVEPDDAGGYRVLPLRNPQLLVAKFQFRGEVWRTFAEEE